MKQALTELLQQAVKQLQSDGVFETIRGTGIRLGETNDQYKAEA